MNSTHPCSNLNNLKRGWKKAARFSKCVLAVFSTSAGLLLITSSETLAASATWQGTGDGTWSTSGNWIGGTPGSTTVVTSTDVATFATNPTQKSITVDANRNIGGIVFDTGVGAMTIGTATGNALYLSAGGSIQTTAGVTTSQNVNAPIVMEGNASFLSNATSSSGYMVFGGIISAASNVNSTLTLGGNNAGTNKVSGAIVDGSGTTALSVSSGKWTIAGNNTFSGGMSISGASTTVTLSGSNANAGGTTLSGATVYVTNDYAFGNSGRTLTVTASATINNGDSKLHTLANNIALNSGTLTLSTSNISSPLSITGPISGGGVILKYGPGALTLSGSNSYSGNTILQDGILQIGSDYALGSGTLAYTPASGKLPTIQSSDANARTIANALTFSGASGKTFAFGAAGTGDLTFTNTGAAALPTGSGTFQIVNNVTFANSFTGSGNALVKTGAGTMILTGTSTYTGTTGVNAGTLKVNGALGNTAVTVGNGATLGGSGSIAGTVTVNSGGILAPGNSPGTLSTGAMTLNGGSTFQWQINNATGVQGTNWDLNNITGTLTLNGSGTNTITIDIQGLNSSNVLGSVQNWNSAVSGTWTIATASGGITGFSTDAFTLQTTYFTSNNSLGGGAFSIAKIGNSLDLIFTAATNSSTLGFQPATLVVKAFVGGTSGQSTSLVNSGTSSTGYTLAASNNGVSISDSGLGSVAGSGTSTVDIRLANNANGSATSGTHTYTVTATNTGNASDTGGNKTVTVTADIYQQASLNATATTASTGAAANLNLSNAASTDGGQRAGVTVTGLTIGNSATGRSSNFQAPALSATPSVGTATTANTTSTIGTVALKNKRLNGTYSASVSAAVSYTDSTLASQATVSGQTFAVSGRVNGNASTSRTDVYSADILSGQSYSGYGLESGAGKGTVASLLHGTASADTTVSMSFDSTSVHNVLPLVRSSDILTLSGIAPKAGGGNGNGGTELTDTFVLQLTYDKASAIGDQYIAYFNSDLDRWVNATFGNGDGINLTTLGGVANGEILGAYNPLNSADNQLGAYGYDSATGTVWAVVDYTGEFTVVPEPSTWSMVVGGIASLLAIQGARKRLALSI